MKMPWGKFKGKSMHQIPSGYLYWLATECEDKDICLEADEEYQYREHYNTHWWDENEINKRKWGE